MTTTSAKQFTEDVAVSKLVLSASDSTADPKGGIKLKLATGELTLSILNSRNDSAVTKVSGVVAYVMYLTGSVLALPHAFRRQ